MTTLLSRWLVKIIQKCEAMLSRGLTKLVYDDILFTLIEYHNRWKKGETAQAPLTIGLDNGQILKRVHLVVYNKELGRFMAIKVSDIKKDFPPSTIFYAKNVVTIGVR